MTNTFIIDIPAIARDRIRKQLAPEWMIDLIQVWAHDRCAVFAIALAEAADAGSLMLFVAQDGHLVHACAMVRGRMLDAYGIVTDDDVQARYDMPLRAIRVPVEVLREQLGDVWTQQRDAAHEAVRTAARFYRWKVTK